MFRCIVLYFSIALLLPAQLIFSISLKEKFENYTTAPSGSFIVTEHQKTVSFLRVHSLQPPFLFLEEINIPSHFLSKSPIDWDEWLKNKAPHHTSWLLYQIDLTRCKIVDCYSFSRGSYISLHDQHSFLTTLMTLPLEHVPPQERKKIGPKSEEDTLDSRKIWNPPKILHGKKYSHPHFQMMHARWPKDDSELSGKLIDLYFDQEQPLFPFPYWIEIGDGYNVFKIRVIDSGSSSEFPFKDLPTRVPTIDTATLLPTGLHISIKDALPFKDFHIIVSTTHDNIHETTPLPCIRSIKEGVTHLYISEAILQQNLTKKSLYTLCIIPIEDPSLMMEYPHPIRLHLPGK